MVARPVTASSKKLPSRAGRLSLEHVAEMEKFTLSVLMQP